MEEHQELTTPIVYFNDVTVDSIALLLRVLLAKAEARQDYTPPTLDALQVRAAYQQADLPEAARSLTPICVFWLRISILLFAK